MAKGHFISEINEIVMVLVKSIIKTIHINEHHYKKDVLTATEHP